MPDTTGKLTEEEKQRVSTWLSKFQRPAAICPICGNQQWMIGDHLVQPVTIGPGHVMNIFGTAISYPTVMLVSAQCGYTMYVNAVIVGLVPAAENADGK